MLNPRLQPGEGIPQNWRLVKARQLALEICCRDDRYQWLANYPHSDYVPKDTLTSCRKHNIFNRSSHIPTIFVKNKDMNRLTKQFFQAPTGVFTQSDVAALIDGTDFSRHGSSNGLCQPGDFEYPTWLLLPGAEFQKSRLAFTAWLSGFTAPATSVWRPPSVITAGFRGCLYLHLRELWQQQGIWRRLWVCSVTNVFHSIRSSMTFSAATMKTAMSFHGLARKALVDYLYVHQLKWTRIDEPIASLRIDEDELACVKAEELKALLDNYSNGRVKRFLTGWLSEVKS